MTTVSSSRTAATETWRSDFFGTINEMPPEPVGLIEEVLESMATEPGFHSARRALIRDLQLGPGQSVVEAGCGTGSALPDLISVLGLGAQVVGVDPSRPFLERARSRASGLKATGARYEEGDARRLPLADAEHDAAYCDKLLIHVEPALGVISEMARVTRAGGRVGALEWLPRFAISTTDSDLADRYNEVYRQAVCNYHACSNLERYLHEAGLIEVRTRTFLASASSLDEHSFWRLFLLAQIPLFSHAGLISEDDGRRFTEDVEELDRRSEFNAAFLIRTGVGVKPA
ncbi:MAG: methyltransferase domain-containing protein [Candidatus Dormibacteraeota bacterium]|jgi:ubiquinone/menaquinone biosynthesis C-methylase UbiE|nr:methyltransferase domain-containing protein [Candidatus Dormibacteraeota bacterium]